MSFADYLPDNSPVVIVGMHRSGTSLISRVLSELGVHIGAELDGHYESVCFKAVNRRLLQDTGAHWAKPAPFVSGLGEGDFRSTNVDKAKVLLEDRLASYGRVSDGQRWGWKDPRNTLTLPLWLELFPEARVIHVVRNGIDVALSLYRRESKRYLHRSLEKRMFPPTIAEGYRLWERYLEIGLRSEYQCRHWMFLKYEDVCTHPRTEIGRICAFLNLPTTALEHIQGSVIKRPARRTPLETLRLWLLLRLGRINDAPLLSLGYGTKIG